MQINSSLLNNHIGLTTRLNPSISDGWIFNIQEAVTVLEYVVDKSIATSSSVSTSTAVSRKVFMHSCSPHISFSAFPLAILYAVDNSFESTIINYDRLTEKVFNQRREAIPSSQREAYNGFITILFLH